MIHIFVVRICCFSSGLVCSANGNSNSLCNRPRRNLDTSSRMNTCVCTKRYETQSRIEKKGKMNFYYCRYPPLCLRSARFKWPNVNMKPTFSLLPIKERNEEESAQLTEKSNNSVSTKGFRTKNTLQNSLDPENVKSTRTYRCLN